MERSIFTVEEDPNSPWDLQLVTKRYITGKDEVKEIGSDAPLPLNRNEQPVDEGTILTHEDTDVQQDDQEILWTKRYQGNVHEGGALPAEDRPIYDMIQGSELGDGVMNDPTCEVPGTVRNPSGLGADQMFTELPETEDAAPEVPWIPIRTGWYVEAPLSKKAIMRILKEEKVDTSHYDVRQRLVQKGPHKFPNGKTSDASLVVVEVKTNCLQKHFPAQSQGMGEVSVPPARRDIYGTDFIAGIGETVVPMAEQDIYHGNYISGPIVLSAKEMERDVADLKAFEQRFKLSVNSAVERLKKAGGVGYAGGIGQSPTGITLSPFSPPPPAFFLNTMNFVRNPPPMPNISHASDYVKSSPPSVPQALVPALPKLEAFDLPADVKKNVDDARNKLMTAITIWTNKDPPYKFSWKERLYPQGSFSDSDPNFGSAMYKAMQHLFDLYQYKEFKVTDTGTWEPNITRLWKGVQAVQEVNQQVFKQFVDSITSALTNLKDSAQASFDAVTEIPPAVVSNLKRNAGTIRDNVVQYSQNVKDSLAQYTADLKDWFKGLMDAIKQDVGAVKDYILAWIKGFSDALLADAKDLQKQVAGLFDYVKNWVETNINYVVGTVRAEIQDVVQKAADEAKKIVSDIRADAQKMVDTLRNDVMTTYNTLKADFTSTINKITTDFNATYKKLVDSLQGTIDVVKKQGEILTDQIKKVTDLKTAYENFVKEAGQRFSNIEAKIGTVSAQATQAASSAGEKKGLFANLFSDAKRHIHVGQTRHQRSAPPMPEYVPPYPRNYPVSRSGFVSEVEGFVW